MFDRKYMPETGGEARSFWIVEPGRGEIRTESLPDQEDGDVLIKTLYSGISRGTESLVFTGAIPASEHERMRAPFQAGDFPGPVKYGYSSVGRVERGPDDLQGRIVFCLYPHQTYYIVPVEAVHPLPDNVPAHRAILAANLETAINGLWDAAPRVGDRIAIVGAGTVGCLVAWLAARIPGCSVELIDIDTEKAHIAARLGARFLLPQHATEDADVVIHTSGTGEGLTTALGLAGFEATVVELSWFGNRRPALPLGESFHSRRLTLRASQVGTVATAQRSRWTAIRRMRFALGLLSDSTLDGLITGQSGFGELPEIMRALAKAPGNTLCHRIVYDD